MRKTFLSALILAMLGASLQAQYAAREGLSEEGLDNERAKLRVAATQHEIIAILLKDGQYSQVLPEFRKILELNLSGENEKAVVEEAWIIVEQLRRADQYNLAHQIVEATFTQAGQLDNKFALYMLKGKIYRDQGLLEEAIQTYRKAQQIQH